MVVRVGGPAYGFSHHPTDDQLKALIRDSYRDLLKEEGFSAEWRPSHIMTSLGALQPAKDFLGGTLTSRRIMRKGGGIEDPNNEQDLKAKQSAFLNGFVPIEKPSEGKEWTAMEDISPHSRGEVLSVDPATDVMNGELGFVNVGGHWIFARMLDQAAREKLSRPSDNRPPVQPTQSYEPEKPVEQSESDARTLYVDFDDQGIRYKEWRRAVQESRDYSYQDWPHEGPTTVLHLLKHMQKFGGDSRQWLQLWARQRGVYDSDRVMHELRCLTDAIYFGATYDQLNLPVLRLWKSLQEGCSRLWRHMLQGHQEIQIGPIQSCSQDTRAQMTWSPQASVPGLPGKEKKRLRFLRLVPACEN